MGSAELLPHTPSLTPEAIVKLTFRDLFMLDNVPIENIIADFLEVTMEYQL